MKPAPIRSACRAAALALPLLLTACVSRFQSQELRSTEIGYRGDPLPQEVWTKSAEKLEAEKARRAESPKGRLHKGSSTTWLLPGFFQHRQLEVEPTEATVYRGTWADLLTPLLISLPLRLNYQEHYYTPGQAEPVGSQTVYWTPIWANSVKEGTPPTRREYDASGLPLLWSTFRLRDNQRPWQVKGFTTLWSLGTMSMKGRDPKWEGYFTAPLLLGGLPGAALWSDARVKFREKADDTVTARFEWHGPAMGFLGYQDYRGPEDFDPEEGTTSAVTRSRRLVFGGLLWYDGTRRDEAGKVVKAAHGPLWSAFGWGEKDGRRTVRLFGFSI